MKDTRILNLAKILTVIRSWPNQRKRSRWTARGGGRAGGMSLRRIAEGGRISRGSNGAPSLQEMLFKQGKPHHFDTLSPYQKAMVNHLDGSIGIASSPNTRALTNWTCKQARLSKTRSPYANNHAEKWCITLYPTQPTRRTRR